VDDFLLRCAAPPHSPLVTPAFVPWEAFLQVPLPSSPRARHQLDPLSRFLPVGHDAPPCRHRAPPRTGARARRAAQARTPREHAQGPAFRGRRDYLVFSLSSIHPGIFPCLPSLHTPPWPSRPAGKPTPWRTPVRARSRASSRTRTGSRASTRTPSSRALGSYPRAKPRWHVAPPRTHPLPPGKREGLSVGRREHRTPLSCAHVVTHTHAHSPASADHPSRAAGDPCFPPPQPCRRGSYPDPRPPFPSPKRSLWTNQPVWTERLATDFYGTPTNQSPNK
jgi:hypothetical protein